MERADPVTRNKSIWFLELDNSVFRRLTFNRADPGYRTDPRRHSERQREPKGEGSGNPLPPG
jgi:hypothetical protein